jgi:hypothetical protein
MNVSNRGLLLAAAIFFAAVSGQAAADSAADRSADLDALTREYVDVAPAFSVQARADAHVLIDGLRKQAPAMTDAQFELALGRVAGLADNGHDSFYPGDGAWSPHLRLPLRLIWFPDAIVVARAAPDYADLLGAQVLSVEGLSPADLLQRLRPLQGGLDIYRRWQLTWIFHSAEALHALGVAKTDDRLALRLKLKDGTIVERSVVARPVADMPPGRHPVRFWPPALWPGEGEKGWRTAIDANAAPLYLQDGNAWFRMVELPAQNALYVQFRSNFDEGDDKIAPFVARVSARLKAGAPQNLVLDLRFDTGGDNTQNRDLMRDIANKVPGRIYLLLGNYTFSAGIASAAALVHDGGAKVTIVGDDVADRMHWWSEHANDFCTPHAKVCFPLNTGYWDVVNGCKANPACYGDQYDLIVPGGLAPRLRAPLTAADWSANRDPGLDAVAADLARQN